MKKPDFAMERGAVFSPLEANTRFYLSSCMALHADLDNAQWWWTIEQNPAVGFSTDLLFLLAALATLNGLRRSWRRREWEQAERTGFYYSFWSNFCKLFFFIFFFWSNLCELLLPQQVWLLGANDSDATTVRQGVHPFQSGYNHLKPDHQKTKKEQ